MKNLRVKGIFGSFTKEWMGTVVKVNGKQIDIRWDNGAMHYATVDDILSSNETGQGIFAPSKIFPSFGESL